MSLKLLPLCFVALLAYGCINHVAGQQCPENQQYTTCGTACEPSCAQPEPRICTMQCIIGCQCKSGFVRDSSGNCISPRNC